MAYNDRGPHAGNIPNIEPKPGLKQIRKLGRRVDCPRRSAGGRIRGENPTAQAHMNAGGSPLYYKIENE